MAIEVKVEGKKLIITADIDAVEPSKSQKNMVVVSTHGNMVTAARYNDKPLILGLNCYYKP